MRVALLTPRFWPEVRRGTERHVHDLAIELRRRGDEPVVVTTGPPRGPGRIDGIAVLRLPRLPERGPLEAYSTHLPLVGAALGHVGCDVVHAFHAGEAVAAIAWARRRRVPVVYSHMGIPTEADRTERRRRGEWTFAAFARCDAVLALSDFAAGAAEAVYGRRPEVVHPGVDLTRFAPGSERTADPTVVCAASDDPRKHLETLLAAWPSVRARHPDARLLLDHRAASRGGPGVERVAMDDTAALARLNAGAWAAVLPSVDEAFGLVLVEALATGTPVVARAAGGMPAIVDRPGIGRLFEGGARELAAALDETLALAHLPGTRAACRAAAERFPVQATGDAHAALYRRLLQSTNAR